MLANTLKTRVLLGHGLDPVCLLTRPLPPPVHYVTLLPSYSRVFFHVSVTHMIPLTRCPLVDRQLSHMLCLDTGLPQPIICSSQFMLISRTFLRLCCPSPFSPSRHSPEMVSALSYIYYCSRLSFLHRVDFHLEISPTLSLTDSELEGS